MSTTAQLANITVQIVNPVIAATTEVFRTCMGYNPVRRELGLKDKKTPYFAITSVIGLSGRVTGSICLSLPQRTAFSAVHRMVDVQCTEVDQLVCDTVGEFTNMIAGTARSTLQEFELELGLPNVVTGDGHDIKFPQRSQPMFVTFNSEIGPFMLVFGFCEH
ncbi:MAG: chemotaxis protein CheX [Planctomycetaceae bacterium]|nr:chemotaxis protein CheX [Planctomycetaceae bacterium]